MSRAHVTVKVSLHAFHVIVSTVAGYKFFCFFFHLKFFRFIILIIKSLAGELKKKQTCQISGFRPVITDFFIALPAPRLSRENLRQNDKISSIYFSDDILKFSNKINWLKKCQLPVRSHFTAR